MDAEQRWENGMLFANPATPLPHEMMVEIFLQSVNSDDLAGCTPSRTSPPFTLTWVCRYWRKLAISLQNLWTNISLGDQGTDPADDVRLLDLWIQRAGPARLMRISLCHEMKDSERPVFFDPNRGERYLIGMKMLTDKVLSISHRWHTLELHALDLYVLDPILRALVTTGAPQLETLSISTKYFDFFGSVHFMDLSSCPSLCNLRLLCPMLCPTANSHVAANMTNLEIRFCPLMRDCLTWLSICPNLERLNVRFFRAISSSLPRERSPLTLLQLTHLSISCFSDDSDPSPLLDLLILPALRDLSLDMNGLVHSELSQTWSDQMHGIIRRSKAPLERLTMLGTPMTSDVLIRLLHTTPRLTELVLSGSVISDQLLISLAVNMKLPTNEEMLGGGINGDTLTFSLCPGLESLELREFECSLDVLVSFICARCRVHVGARRLLSITDDSPRPKNPGHLKNLTLIWSPHPTLLDHPSIRECVAGGLEIINRSYNGGKLK
ncbi:uncharacterized protein FOMMEDRAFT_159640 [Fomitiporia mediterranea MF3/22]|uniref:uncharacterized protein n=1 Tax=Fomitiporia mediterranea (strain MF3/22) TaxID=694068 RepID=UPI00044094AC|nr:uncharacterized protein FOMMEDRAFT_159640 [Fomitiporia mediterranea MF3/22]EJD00047.1 hypothetical protein FOMMEDRAFT_159640 [Fomitiporia mediterranea MF3/22]